MTKTHSSPLPSLLFLVGLIVTPPASGATPPAAGNEYTIVNLGTLGGTFSEGNAINNSGQVIGYSSSDAGNRATLFSGTGSGNTDLGSLGGRISFAHAINDSGQIVGTALTSGSGHAALFSGTGSGNTDLGTLGGFSSSAIAINNSGQIVGSSYNTGEQALCATLYSGTGSGNKDLGTLGSAGSLAFSINDSGKIVGYSYTTGGMDHHATLYSGTGSGNVDLGTLGGSNSSAYGINNSGRIVGSSDTSGNTASHATLFSGTGSGNTDLGTLGGTSSIATVINNSGQIAGVSDITGNAAQHIFIYQNGVMRDLNSLAANSSSALGVTEITNVNRMGKNLNDWGQIAATGTISGESRALLLNPTSPLTSTAHGGLERNTKFVGGMNYSKFTTSGGGSTTVSLLGGVAGSGGSATYGLNRDVDVSLTGGTPSIFGNQVEVTGTGGDTFVLSLTYQGTPFGNNDPIALGWLNASGAWVNAVAGNEGGSARFIEGAWNDSYTLGSYGIDRANNSVWAVINHNSTFGIIPEPSATLSGLVGAFLFLRRRRSGFEE